MTSWCLTKSPLLAGRHFINGSLLAANIGALGYFMTDPGYSSGIAMLAATSSMSTLMGVRSSFLSLPRRGSEPGISRFFVHSLPIAVHLTTWLQPPPLYILTINPVKALSVQKN